MDIQEILKPLNAICRQDYNARTVFEDWVGLMFYALQRNDPEYLKIVGRYRNTGEQGRREIDHFCHAFGLLMDKMKKTNRELLGELYMTWEVSNKYTGQFFTPWCVAEMMARMLQPDSEHYGKSSEHNGSGFEHYINDCCCGAGVMLIATVKTMKNAQLDKTVFVGQDIDFTCVMMCALNFTFFNLHGYVIYGNSLTNERRRIFKTTRSYMGGSIMEIPVEQIPQEEVMVIEKAIREPSLPKLIQPGLF